MAHSARPLPARAVAALGFVAIAAYGASGIAQEALGASPPGSSPPAAEGIEQAVVARYWELGRPRWFFATALEAGYAYARPKFALGYGRPYWNWVGLEAHPLVSLGGLGQYAGIGAALPGVNLRAGGRYFFPFSRSFLVPSESFTRTDIELLNGPKADYLTLESELTLTLPVPSGSLFAVMTGYRTFLVPDGYYLFEESLRAVMDPPYIWRARLGYLAAFGRDGAIRLGPAGEVIGLPGRGEIVVRAGAIASLSIDAHVEAQASFIPVIVSPDKLGIAGGDFGQLGVRFRWATDSDPEPGAAGVRADVERPAAASKRPTEPR